jgi:arylsulfatase
MECFAGFLSHADEQIGRVLDFLTEVGDRENTMVVVVSDNGASAEGGATGSINDVRMVNLDPASNDEMYERIDDIGGPLSHNNYPWGWTMAGNTPFRRWKREVHEGSGRPVHPALAKVWRDDAIRTQCARGRHRPRFDLIGIGRPRTSTEWSNHRSKASFVGPLLMPRHRRRATAMLRDARRPRSTTTDGGRDLQAARADVQRQHRSRGTVLRGSVKLYHVAEDYSECHDLADTHPDKLAEMVELWWRTPGLPLDNRPLAALENPRPARSPDRVLPVLRTAPVSRWP